MKKEKCEEGKCGSWNGGRTKVKSRGAIKSGRVNVNAAG